MQSLLAIVNCKKARTPPQINCPSLLFTHSLHRRDNQIPFYFLGKPPAEDCPSSKKIRLKSIYKTRKKATRRAAFH